MNDNLPAHEVFPELATNRPGVVLRGMRSREGLTQAQLAALVDIPQRHIQRDGKRQAPDW